VHLFAHLSPHKCNILFAKISTLGSRIEVFFITVLFLRGENTQISSRPQERCQYGKAPNPSQSDDDKAALHTTFSHTSTIPRTITHQVTSSLVNQRPSLHCSIDSSMPRKSLLLALTVASAAVKCSSARLLIGDVIAESEVRDFVEFYSSVLSPSLFDYISEKNKLILSII
jgi:hypothetical protein